MMVAITNVSFISLNKVSQHYFVLCKIFFAFLYLVINLVKFCLFSNMTLIWFTFDLVYALNRGQCVRKKGGSHI